MSEAGDRSRALGKRGDMIVHELAPYNAEPPRAALADGVLTAAEAFYVRSHGEIPDAGEVGALRVGGLVAHPQQFTTAQLRENFGVARVTATLQCAGNRRAGLLAVAPIPGEAPWGPGATGTAEWAGTALRDVLAAAVPDPEARYVELIGADLSQEAEPPQCFGASIPLHKARGEEVLLADEMNGAPLAPAHGAPLRAVVPGYIGARSVKWLTEVNLRRDPSENFFQARTYRLLPGGADASAGLRGEGFALGAIAVNADFLAPADGGTVPAGPTELLGYAYAGDDRPIVRVDVSGDGGASWSQAQLLDAPSRWAWRRWRAVLELAPGDVELVARAFDGAAATQPEDPAQLWNPKGYANNSWARLTLRAR